MSEEPTGSGLSFERAEFAEEAQPKLACGYCKQPLRVQYWQIARRPACDACRESVQRELASSQSRARFLSALGQGSLAAAAGSVAWVVISKVTGYQIGIVAIGIGFLVGKAVRKGAGGFGGTRYQALAVFLTYSAIALASIPVLIEAVRTHHSADTAPHQIGLGTTLQGWAFLIGIAYASPFLGGAQNAIGLIIIAIGLYQAWKITRALPISVLGPFPIESERLAELTAAADAAP